MAAPRQRRAGGRNSSAKPPATQRGPSGRGPPAPRPPPPLTAVTRRPPDRAGLRRLRTPIEPPEEPHGAPPAVGVRLPWRPEPMEDAVTAGLEAELGSEVGRELLCGGSWGRPLHRHRGTQPGRGHGKAQPLHRHTRARPLSGHAKVQPLSSDAEAQPSHSHAALQPTEFPHCCPPPSRPPEALWDLLAQLGSALPARSLHFHAEPPLEPAATDLNLMAGKPQQLPRGAPKTPGAPQAPQQPAALLQDYQHFLTATGSDFLRAILNLSSADSSEELHPRGTAEPRPAAQLTAEPRPAAPTPNPEELQHRLHRLWAALRLPTGERLAMATKYGPAAARRRLTAALELWEEAAALIRRRERLLALLEGMELRTSDPNRFFRRQGRPGLPSSAALHGETRARRRLNAEALSCEEELRGMLRRLREEFGDVVTLRGRSYEEKLRRDRGEMLYRLQQGRRAAAMGGIMQSALGRR